MQNRTTKHHQTAPEPPYKNPNSPTKTNRKAELSPQKNFSALILALSKPQNAKTLLTPHNSYT